MQTSINISILKTHLINDSGVAIVFFVKNIYIMFLAHTVNFGEGFYMMVKVFVFFCNFLFYSILFPIQTNP